MGRYPIGYIYSCTKIEELVENEIVISLAIANEEELSEIEDSKDNEKFYNSVRSIIWISTLVSN